jgi:signal transduction histidine kinase
VSVRGSSIQWRIMLWLSPLLALVFAVSLFWLSVTLKNTLHAANLEMVHRLSLTAVRYVEASMLGKGDERPQDWLARRMPPPQGGWIRVIGARGQLYYSSDTTEAATEDPLDLGAPSCAPCHERGPGPIPETSLVTGPEGVTYQVLATPLPNREDCRSCHGADGPNLGMVLAGQSVEPIRALVRNVQLGVAIAGAVALMLTLMATRVVLGRLLGRPLLKLVAGARRIGAGNLRHAIKLSDRTELTVLADALNASTARLAEMIQRIERQRDEYETLYRFTDQLSRAVSPEERRLKAVKLATQFLGAECVFVQADYRQETQTGAGTVTLRGSEGFEDVAFQFGPDSQQAVPTFLRVIVQRWLKGDYDGMAKVEEGWLVGYPVQSEGRHLGLLLLPAPREDEAAAEVPAAPDDDLVRALCRHIAVALEFSEMQNELVVRERLAAIGETIAGLAHCLKNALNALRAGQYITGRAVVRGDPMKLRKGWGITKTGIQQVERLALDMLYYVKDRAPQREPTEVNALVREVADLVEEMAVDKEVTVRVETDEKVGREPLDRTAVYRAVLNLVTNAIDACTESETGNQVVIRTRSEPDGIQITVEDNGIGMSAEVRSRLFDRFFSTKAGKGTGLGLPVVKKIVKEHGGTLEVESEPGQGSSFHLRLPRVD